MYLYIAKTYKYEQIKLLEMRSNTCIYFRNPRRIFGVTKNLGMHLTVAGSNTCNRFTLDPSYRSQCIT